MVFIIVLVKIANDSFLNNKTVNVFIVKHVSEVIKYLTLTNSFEAIIRKHLFKKQRNFQSLQNQVFLFKLKYLR